MKLPTGSGSSPLLAALALAFALFGLLLPPAAAQSCPTLKVGIGGPRKAKNEGVYDVRVAVKNTGDAAAAGTALTVSEGSGVYMEGA